MYSEEAILENRKKVLARKLPQPSKPTPKQVTDFKESMKTFDDRAYVIYDAVLNLIYLSTDGEDSGQYLGLFVIGKF